MQHCMQKMQQYENYFFYWPTSAVFWIIICFSSSSINAKKKFWGVPHLLHMCVILGKNLVLVIMPKNTPKIGVFGFCITNSPLICKFCQFKSCTVIAFMILLKLHVWEKSDSRVKYKNTFSQSDCRIFKL